MNRRWCLGFTLSSLAVMAPANAMADEPAESAPTPAHAPLAPTPNPTPDPAPDATPGPRSEHLFFGADGNYTYQNLYGISSTGIGVSAVLANQVGSLSAGVVFDFIRGWTEDGLQTTTLGIGPFLERQIDQLRLGGGIRVGTFDVSRVTSTSSLLSTSCGVFLRVTYDLVDLGSKGHSTLYVIGKGSVDSVDAPLYAASVGVGLRL